MSAAAILIDWGTSSFRLWLTDASANIIATQTSNAGLLSLKPDQFQGYLESQLDTLIINNQTPVLICGMAGAAQGWAEVPYLNLPTSLYGIGQRALRIENTGRDIRILPGLACVNPDAPDVMRGEETLLVGAMDLQAMARSNTHWYCLPGTHTKWVKTLAKEIKAFHTVMTGELFALLRNASTLSHFLQTPENHEQVSNTFNEAVALTLEHPDRMLQQLFSIRAKSLVFTEGQNTGMADRLSGLLIGHEIAGMLNQGVSSVTLIASGPQSARYEIALSMSGLHYDLLDAEHCVQQGLILTAKQLWPDAYTA